MPSPSHTTYLAIDPGEARTGTASGDAETRLASPLRVIEVPAKQRDRLLHEIHADIESTGARALVMGLPLEMESGDEGPSARRARAMGDWIANETGLPIHFVDERLTSAEADWQMARSGLTHKQKKARRDALAAANILRTFLEALDETGDAPSD